MNNQILYLARSIQIQLKNDYLKNHGIQHIAYFQLKHNVIMRQNQLDFEFLSQNSIYAKLIKE
ncbi:MAG: hypothetical protein CMB73_00015 [Euryarchaeota archaeon]|nr:hypothetical protein [Euryarchaeota archaeon]